MQPPPESPLPARKPVAVLALGQVAESVLAPTIELLARFGIAAEQQVVPVAFRENPDFSDWAETAAENGYRLVIAASHETAPVRSLARQVPLPVIRVPVARDDSPAAALAQLTDMAADIELTAPGTGAFATVAVGEAGARNAALLAVSILALTDARLRAAWHAFRDEQTQAVLSQPPPAG